MNSKNYSFAALLIFTFMMPDLQGSEHNEWALFTSKNSTLIKQVFTNEPEKLYPLFFKAIEEDQRVAVETLLSIDQLIDVSKAFNGITPLLQATQYERHALVDALLAREDININTHNCIPNPENPTETIPLTTFKIVLFNNDQEMIKKFMSHSQLAASEKRFGLLYAVLNEHVDAVHTIASYDIDTNVTYRNGWTPLMCAVYKHNDTILNILLAHTTTNVNFQCAGRKLSALLVAAMYGNEFATKQLLTHQANIHHKDVNENSAVAWASTMGYQNITRLLCEAGATVNTSIRNTEPAGGGRNFSEMLNYPTFMQALPPELIEHIEQQNFDISEEN